MMKAPVISIAGLPVVELETAFPKGTLLVFPTDTVYGLGARPDDDVAIQKLRKLKSRKIPAPFSLHLANVDAVHDVCLPLTPIQQQRLSKLLPGPYTVLLPANSQAPTDAVLAGKIGLRVPGGSVFTRLEAALGPLLGTSVNRVGKPPLNDVEAILKDFGDDISLLIVTDEPLSQQSSAVIDLCVEPLQILRGELPSDLLQAVKRNRSSIK